MIQKETYILSNHSLPRNLFVIAQPLLRDQLSIHPQTTSPLNCQFHMESWKKKLLDEQFVLLVVTFDGFSVCGFRTIAYHNALYGFRIKLAYFFFRYEYCTGLPKIRKNFKFGERPLNNSSTLLMRKQAVFAASGNTGSSSGTRCYY